MLERTTYLSLGDVSLRQVAMPTAACDEMMGIRADFLEGMAGNDTGAGSDDFARGHEAVDTSKWYQLLGGYENKQAHR